MHNILALVAESPYVPATPLPPRWDTSQTPTKRSPANISSDNMVIEGKTMRYEPVPIAGEIAPDQQYITWAIAPNHGYNLSVLVLYIFMFIMTIASLGWHVYKKSGRELYLSWAKIIWLSILLVVILQSALWFIFTKFISV